MMMPTMTKVVAERTWKDLRVFLFGVFATQVTNLVPLANLTNQSMEPYFLVNRENSIFRVEEGDPRMSDGSTISDNTKPNPTGRIPSRSIHPKLLWETLLVRGGLRIAS